MQNSPQVQRGTDPDARAVPLVCDLDGTLTPTDTLVEAFFTMLRREPTAALLTPVWLMRGRAVLKREIAERSGFDPTHVPLREDLLDYLRRERDAGRRVVLATAADRKIADAIAARAAVFDAVYASDGTNNLKGRAKLEFIRRQEGPDFAYAGNSKADIPVWEGARAAILVHVEPRIAEKIRSRMPVEKEFKADGSRLLTWAKALRVHQWLKNVLIFVPLLTSFSFSQSDKVVAAVCAFMSFCLIASATYMANDLWDLESDRRHPRKRHRPFASGNLPIAPAVTVALGLLVAGVALASTVSLPLVAMLVIYLVTTTAYSWTLKSYVLIDVVCLAVLYTLRVLAGATAIDVQVTPWLLAFSMFTFLSLALVKRCSELVSVEHEGKAEARGRDYRVSDLVVLWPMGVGAGLCAVVVFGLFVANALEGGAYANTQLLWCVGVGLLYWLGRLWIKTARGEMHDDPIVFTLRDFGTRTVLVGMVLVTVLAHFL